MNYVPENYYILTSDGELYHWGIKGMKWGVRRYQNKDGTLTAAGKKRRNKTINGINKMYDKANAYAKSQADRYESKGKTAKASVMNEMIKRNEKSRAEKVKAVSEMSEEKFRATRRQELANAGGYGYAWLERNTAMMTIGISRLNERNAQKQMGRVLSSMSEEKLADLKPADRFDRVHNEHVDRLRREMMYQYGVIAATTLENKARKS